MGQTEPHFLSDPMSDRKKSFRQLCVIFIKTAWCTTLHGENAVNFLCTPKWRELEDTLHPQKFGCTSKNEGKRVHVPSDEKTCGHDDKKWPLSTGKLIQ